MLQNRLHAFLGTIKRSLKPLVIASVRFILKRKWLRAILKKGMVHFPGITDRLKRLTNATSSYILTDALIGHTSTSHISISYTRAKLIYKKLNLNMEK